ncbi:MAG: metallophosphoesterase family protein [Syntrophobacteraceae bacterium]
MKIVVMSDTHLTRTTDEFRDLCAKFCDGADMVIHLGDWERVELLNFLERYPLEAVSGNMDDHFIHSRLPTKKIVNAGGFRLGVTHGWGSPGGIRNRIGQELPGVDAILFGHTHQALMVRENGVLWFNPGSVSMGRGSSRNSLGILRVGDRIDAEIIQL